MHKQISIWHFASYIRDLNLSLCRNSDSLLLGLQMSFGTKECFEAKQVRVCYQWYKFKFYSKWWKINTWPFGITLVFKDRNCCETHLDDRKLIKWLHMSDCTHWSSCTLHNKNIAVSMYHSPDFNLSTLTSLTSSTCQPRPRLSPSMHNFCFLVLDNVLYNTS